jgi:hypothetical protein
MTAKKAAKSVVGADARVKHNSAAAMRGTRESADADRLNNDGTALSAAERRRLLREDAVQDILPVPPEMPGYHLCWLTTTNASDPIFRRLKQGYTPVRADELIGFEYYRSKEGDFAGCVQCREMVLFKIPQQTYEDLMTIYHHDMPNEEEQSIVEKLKKAQVVDSNGVPLGELQGAFNDLGKERTPIFN